MSFIFTIYVQPGASKTEFKGFHGEHLKVRIQAAAIDGKANQALIAFLAEQLGIKKSAITLLSGQNSRLKTIRVDADESVIKSKLFHQDKPK